MQGLVIIVIIIIKLMLWNFLLSPIMWQSQAVIELIGTALSAILRPGVPNLLCLRMLNMIRWTKAVKALCMFLSHVWRVVILFDLLHVTTRCLMMAWSLSSSAKFLNREPLVRKQMQQMQIDFKIVTSTRQNGQHIHWVRSLLAFTTFHVKICEGFMMQRSWPPPGDVDQSMRKPSSRHWICI